MKRLVLVTGATGLIGAHTLAPLRERGFDICGLARHPPSQPDFPHVQVDLRNTARMTAMLDEMRPSHVLHCAWDVTHGRFWHAAENLDWVAASLMLARAAASRGTTRFVGVGTCVEYDWSDDGVLPRRESDATRPGTLYGLAKNCTRELLAPLFRDAGVSFAWARVFDLFGFGEAPGRLVPSVVRTLRAGRPFVCQHGQLQRDYMGVADVGIALAQLLASDVAGPVNIASGHSISLRELTQRIAARVGRPDLLTVASLPAAGQPLTMRADVTRLRREVRSPAPNDLEQRLAEIVAIPFGSR